MKIVGIGNSHAGMLHAASLRKKFSNVEFDWLVKPGNGFERIKVEGSRIFAADEDMQSELISMGICSEVELSDYDAVIFAGQTVSALDISYIFRDYVVAGWVSSDIAGQISGLNSEQWSKSQFITENALMDTLVSTIFQNFTYQAVVGAGRACNTPLFVVPQPFLNQSVMLPTATKFRVFRRISKFSCFPKLAECVRQAHEVAFSDLSNVTLLNQGEETITNNFFTKNSFCRDSLRAITLENRVNEDYLHANADFGEIVLRRVLNFLT